MMKKTLLASAIAASLVAGSAQAVTLFQNDSLRFDHYGRIQLQLKNDDGDNEIQNNGSRFGFNITHTINEDLTAFGRVEFRFKADERRRNGEVFDDLRNTYIGLQGGWGKVTVGNFDGIYFSAVSSVLDLFEEDGYRALVEGGDRARGDTLAFETADLGGLRLGLAARHYANVGANSDDEEWNLQAYVQYTGIDNLTLALAVDQNNEDTEKALGNDRREDGTYNYDPVIGLSATYRLDALTTSVLLETSGESRSAGLGLSYNYGQGDIYAAATWHDSWVVVKDGNNEVSSDQESGIDFGLGANYKFTSHFRTYAEIATGNKDNSAIGDQTNFTVGARLSW